MHLTVDLSIPPEQFHKNNQIPHIPKDEHAKVALKNSIGAPEEVISNLKEGTKGHTQLTKRQDPVKPTARHVGRLGFNEQWLVIQGPPLSTMDGVNPQDYALVKDVLIDGQWNWIFLLTRPTNQVRGLIHSLNSTLHQDKEDDPIWIEAESGPNQISEEETTDHIFNSGLYAQSVWKVYARKLGIIYRNMSLRNLLANIWNHHAINDVCAYILKILPPVIMWKYGGLDLALNLNRKDLLWPDLLLLSISISPTS
ncbi:hypothetical protein HAX54_030793 [Datura stramonium]|uniref:Uncharacterized protein n=1 Tax=Datura stramonium TaxID=4076 RepID=A0ABS8SBH8_DATST|nr:hypothetical protein [Datura stramonium]